MIQFQENARADGRADEKTERFYFMGPFQQSLGVQREVKTKS